MKRVKLIIAYVLLICLFAGCGKKADNPVEVGDNGIYFMYNNLLHYYDAEAKLAVPLCFDATCDHSNEKADTCAAHKDTEFRDTYTSFEELKNANGEVLECADGNIWYKNGYIYMIEKKNVIEQSVEQYEYTLVRYDKFGNNKENVITLNSEDESVGLCGDTDIGVKVIGDYLYYVKSIRAGTLGREYIYPEFTDGMADLFENDYDRFIGHVKGRQFYVSLYRVPLDGHTQPERLSEDIFFFGYGNDILEFISRGVILGGNETDGITMVVSDLGATPNMDGSYFFEPECQVYRYMPGDAEVSKVCEFGFESDMFEGRVHWQRKSPYVDNNGRLLFATTETSGTDQEIYRMYAYSPKTNSCEKFYEKLETQSIANDGFINCTHVTSADDDYIYIFESAKDCFYIHIFDKELKQADTFNMNPDISGGNFIVRALGIIAYDNQNLIMAASDESVIIKTEDSEISASSDAIDLHFATEKDGNKWAGNNLGYLYACVIDKSCIGTGKLKITKLMEYPYAGYKY